MLRQQYNNWKQTDNIGNIYNILHRVLIGNLKEIAAVPKQPHLNTQFQSLWLWWGATWLGV